MERISYRETWAEISLDAITHNCLLFKAQLPARCKLMAVVKADGYGHGGVQAAEAALQAGADYLGVAFLDEAIRLREAGIEAPILVLGHTPNYAYPAAIHHSVSVTVHTEEGLDELIACTEAMSRKARVHLKIDTGMSRIGVTGPESALALARKAHHSPYIELEGIFTHFAAADSEDDRYTKRQFAAFLAVIQHVERELGIRIPLRHCCNSAAAVRHPEMRMDMVRAGIGLYGLSPFGRSAWPGLQLQPAMQFKTRIAAVKTVPAGQPVGYGGTYTPTVRPSLPRSRSATPTGSPLAVEPRVRAGAGHRIPIAGRICMDQTMLDVSGLAEITPGEEVILFGGSGVAELPAAEWAEQAGTIHYEIVCQIGKRVPRLYTREGRTVSAHNGVIGQALPYGPVTALF
ncbi:alanine racemase [Paenibacillus sp. P26]|nr:alanine racemase [Paenibacillus sp. P26]